MKNRKKWPLGIAAFVVMSPLMLFVMGCKAPTNEEIKGTIEIVNIETKWVMREYRQWPNPRLVLVPAVTYKIRNASQEPLRYVLINAVFKEPSAVENLGTSFFAAIRSDPVSPGGSSPTITQKSDLGVEGTSLESFKLGLGWKAYSVKLFAQWKGSQPVLLGEWPVSRTIDFKEPEPVHMGGEKKEPEPKK